MGSLVEVLHTFPTSMPMGAEHRQSHHSAHRTSASRSQSDYTPSTSSAAHADTYMTDVTNTPARPARPSRSRAPSRGNTRELALHHASGSQSALRGGGEPNPRYKTDPSTQTSPIHATSGPPSIASRAMNSSSAVPSPYNSPARSVISQSPQTNPSPPSPPRIKVKSLSHIQSFVIDDSNPLASSRASSRLGSAGDRDLSPQYEISEMPVAEIIEMVAGLLTKITTTNDRQHEYLRRNTRGSDNGELTQQTTSVLAFHGKNVPTISILGYLSRIHKYCPTTYEVFLSLLVYFDRMTERVNSSPVSSLRQANQQSIDRHRNAIGSADSTKAAATGDHNHQSRLNQNATPPASGSLGHPRDSTPATSSHNMPPSPPIPAYPSLGPEGAALSHFFVVDSFNIHRLVIAGVTCASKFFSDIFYTNSRYAKVGGLPLPELNHLELQFLLLNDFRLAVPLEEMEAYGTMLVEFYAREVLAQQPSTARSENLVPTEA